MIKSSGYYKSMKKYTVIFIILLLLFFFSCGSEDKTIFQKETRFSLKIGKMEDQISLVQFQGQSFNSRIRIFMRNGLFYISNGSGYKVMEFNSYGDILSMLYNPEENPVPILLAYDQDDEVVSNKQAHPYPFLNVGDLAVTPDGQILVEDTLPENRCEYDGDLEAYLDRVVLRFSREGNLIDYLGQEGVGGTPFPYIERLDVNSQGEIIVITRTMRSWLIFWYSNEGILLYRIEIPLDTLPGPETADVAAHLETIYPDPDSRYLYLKIDYYRTRYEEETNTAVGVDFQESRVYLFDINEGSYQGYAGVPHYFIKDNSFLNEEEMETLYEFKGAAKGGNLFLMSPEGGDFYQILILSRDGKVISRRRIELRDREHILKEFYLSPQGILIALLVKEFEVEIVWWRSDKLISETQDETG